MNRIPVLTLILAFALAGCLSDKISDGELGPDDPAEPPDDGGGPIPPGSPGEAPPSPRDIVLTGFLQLDDCQWLTTVWDYFGDTNPTPLPPQWDQEERKPFSSNVIRIYKCKSVSIDELDRPASVALETSNRGTAPEQCRDRSINVSYLVNLFINDSAIVDVLATNFHAPAKFAEIEVVTDELGTHWRWDMSGNSSTLTYPYRNVAERSVPITPGNIIWPTPNGTNTFDVRYTAIGPDHASRVAYGSLSSDHYLGVDGQHIGGAGAGPEMTVSGPIVARGPLCEPLAG